MGKSWIGYLSPILLLIAGVLMILGNKTMVGCLFIVLSVVSLALKIYMNRNPK